MRLIPIIPVIITTNDDPTPDDPVKNKAADGVVTEVLLEVTPAVGRGNPLVERGNVTVSPITGGL